MRSEKGEFERGTPVHPRSVYGTKPASRLAELNAHMNESGLLTVLLTVYLFGVPPHVAECAFWRIC
jgi:hypothetical protein